MRGVIVAFHELAAPVSAIEALKGVGVGSIRALKTTPRP